MEHEEAGFQATPEGPFLCINNCGFFGSAATMNMCSKCHKDMMLKQDQAKFAASSIGSIVNGSTSYNTSGTPIAANTDLKVSPLIPKLITKHEESSESDSKIIEPKQKDGPNRCTSCNRRVGLTGFNCRCGNLFCGVHRYSDKHECPFDYRTSAQEAIVKANPVVKAEKLEKI